MVAELGTHKMFRSELEAVTNLAVDNEDSVRMADAYIRQWATDILFYDKAHAHEDPELEVLGIGRRGGEEHVGLVVGVHPGGDDAVLRRTLLIPTE